MSNKGRVRKNSYFIISTVSGVFGKPDSISYLECPGISFCGNNDHT
jgi:hypothetical protein